MVNAVKKAMTMLMPMLARAFIPAGDLVDARHCASVFRTPVTRIEFNPIPILAPNLIPLGDYGTITSTNLLVWVAHASRVSGEAVSGSRTFCCGFNDTKRLFPRDSETSTRDARATRNDGAPIVGGSGMTVLSSAGQHGSVALPIALMIGAAKIYFIIFGILTIAGGIVGYVKAGSMASIIAGSISGVLLLLAAWLMPEHQAAGLILALVVSLLLAAQFVPKFFRTFKVMPAGLMSVLSAIGIIVAIAAWLRK
jgi:uncharacterized membrane protein (UPF0136 family)